MPPSKPEQLSTPLPLPSRKRLLRHLTPVLVCSNLLTLAGCQVIQTDSPPNAGPIPHEESTIAATFPHTLDSPYAVSPDVEKAMEEQAPVLDVVHEDLWQRIRAGFAMPEVEHTRVEHYVQWYKRNQRYLDRVSERGERYLYHIVTRLEEEELPLELALLPIIESAFDPFAYSHSRASGIWQFVPATGRQFGLEQNWWYDGRRDVVASTEAAITYLSRLQTMFDGDWLLALAAYNAGQGTVSRAIARNRREGRPTDFWSLRLPRETRNYVPQLLALARVVADPAAHELSLPALGNHPYFVQVDTQSQIDLAQAASLADLEIEELYLLNPGYNRWATNPEGPHSLLLPIDHAEPFSERLAEVPLQERVGWERYQVARGDTLIALARRFNTSVEALRAANDIRGNLIREGQPLLIPTASQPSQSYALSADQRLARRQQNSGQGARIDYTVRSGDSLWRIANQHKVSVSALARWNNMAPGDLIRPGQKLVIWTRQPEPQQLAAAGSTQARAGGGVTRQIAYRVRQGDSLARIANRFNVSVSDIANWNSVQPENHIHPGQILTLFVDVTNSP